MRSCPRRRRRTTSRDPPYPIGSPRGERTPAPRCWRERSSTAGCGGCSPCDGSVVFCPRVAADRPRRIRCRVARDDHEKALQMLGLQALGILEKLPQLLFERPIAVEDSPALEEVALGEDLTAEILVEASSSLADMPRARPVAMIAPVLVPPMQSKNWHKRKFVDHPRPCPAAPRGGPGPQES